MPSTTRKYALWIAIALVVLYVGAGGVAKLAGVPYVHSSFPAFVLVILSGYIFWAARSALFSNSRAKASLPL